MPAKAMTERIDVPHRPRLFLNRVQEICEMSRGRPLLLFMSGGIDSEFAAHFFYKAGRSFTPLIVRYEKNYNEHDIVWARRWCREKKLGYIEVEMQLGKFVCSPDYAKILKTIGSEITFNIGLFPVVQAAAESGFACVTSCREPYIAVEAGEVVEYKTEQSLGLPRWLAARGLRSRHFEFFDSREIRRIFIETAVRVVTAGEKDRSCAEIKALLYQRHRNYIPRTKFHGHEFIFAESPEVFARLYPAGASFQESRARVDTRSIFGRHRSPSKQQ